MMQPGFGFGDDSNSEGERSAHGPCARITCAQTEEYTFASGFTRSHQREHLQVDLVAHHAMPLATSLVWAIVLGQKHQGLLA